MAGPRGPKQAWAIADHFRALEPLWFLGSAGFESLRIVEVCGRKWSVCTKVHTMCSPNYRRGDLWLKSSVTLWPPRLGAAQHRELERLGWYDGVQRLIRRAGYRGRWTPSPCGLFADFWKTLHSVAQARAEAQTLTRLSAAIAQFAERSP